MLLSNDPIKAVRLNRHIDSKGKSLLRLSISDLIACKDVFLYFNGVVIFHNELIAIDEHYSLNPSSSSPPKIIITTRINEPIVAWELRQNLYGVR